MYSFVLKSSLRPLFSEVRGKSELAERNPIFGYKTAGRESLKQGFGRQFSDFRRTSGLGAY